MNNEESEILSSIESDLYRQGRREVLAELRTDLQNVGVFGMGTIAGVEVTKSVYQMESDAGRFLCMYPVIASLAFAAVGVRSALAFMKDARKLQEQRGIWKPVE